MEEKQKRSVKMDLENYLGHSVSDDFFKKCVVAFYMGHPGPAGLGGAAKLGLYVPFESVLEHTHDTKTHSSWPCSEAIHLAYFFCRNEETRKQMDERLHDYKNQFNL